MWEVKGEEYLKKLVQQDLFLSRNLRQIADALAKGKLAITIGLGRSEYEPFLSAGLPIKEVPTPKEGLPASSGYGVLGIVKNPPHPNAIKVFVNWFLCKEGQEFYARVMEQGTRRLDVDTKWIVSDRCGCGEGCHDRGGISPPTKPPRRQSDQCPKTGRGVC